jgi:hypothetical protein
MKTKAEPGSVSTGTLRSRDLVERFLDVLENLDEERAAAEEKTLMDDIYEAVMDDARDGRDIEEDIEEILGDKVQTLVDVLDEFAPAGHHFGAHEGDGADFGFWPDEDSQVEIGSDDE